MERGKVRAGDFIVLGVRAVLGGIAVALALGFAAIVLASNAQAAGTVAPADARSGELLLTTGTSGQYTVAPTVETEVAISVSGVVARTRVTQSFHNPGSEFVEGVYVFPLPEKAAVDHLEMRIGTRVIVGEIQEKDAARKTYEQAKSEGRKAALVEQQRPNLFTNSVAQIGPNEMVRITIEYQQTLGLESGVYRLRFPLAVTPRYVPMKAPVEALPEDAKALEASDAPLLQPAFESAGATDLVNPVDIAVSIDAGVPLGTVSSSYHDVRIDRPDNEHAIVSLAKDQEEADHDFELTWSLAPPRRRRRRSSRRTSPAAITRSSWSCRPCPTPRKRPRTKASRARWCSSSTLPARCRARRSSRRRRRWARRSTGSPSAIASTSSSSTPSRARCGRKHSPRRTRT